MVGDGLATKKIEIARRAAMSMMTKIESLFIACVGNMLIIL